MRLSEGNGPWSQWLLWIRWKRKAELDEKIRAKSQYLDDSVVSTMDPNLVGANKLSQISMYE